nr:MAG TPA: hypothetical protein [Bacteriophage sp.]
MVNRELDYSFIQHKREVVQKRKQIRQRKH